MVESVLAVVLTALAPTLAIIVSFLLSRRDRLKVAKRADEKLDGIHILVNSRLTEALERINELEERLLAHGVEFPEDNRRALT